MVSKPTGGASGSRSGRYALTFGIFALMGTFIPVIGEFVALPCAAVAIWLGFIGIRAYESGRAPKIFPACAGAVFGAVALLVVVAIIMASHPPA